MMGVTTQNILPDNKLAIATAMIESGADYTYTNQNEENLFHLAIKHCRNELCSYLFNNIDIDLEAVDNQGLTPLDVCK